MDKKKTIFLLVGFVFSAISFYLTFQNVSMSSLWQYATQVNCGWMAPAAGVYSDRVPDQIDSLAIASLAACFSSSMALTISQKFTIFNTRYIRAPLSETNI